MTDSPKMYEAGEPFRAKTDHECGGCHGPIEIGLLIVKVTDDTYRHLWCFS